ncbi:M12 family metallo-peptidase [Actinokineospora sp. HUAS TT18]|uniref:M12 family metallo-peptidase n=1 Tax=Actinokineospora sp. HUAS TT18 TaxID=3447451 RepID=UPI003F523968
MSRARAVAVALGIAFVTVVPTQSAAAQQSLDGALPTDLRGTAAIEAIRPRLREVADRNGLTATRLTQILANDPTSRLDRDARLFHVEPAAPAAPSTPSAPAADAFTLHSKPGSKRVIYLDFNGHYLTGTAWNRSKGIDPVTVTPYDTDGSPSTFSAAEQGVVTEVWQRVAEDYAPFDVDVTTQDPGVAAINRTDSADTLYGTRVVIDPTSWYYSGCGCGGVAYVGVYDSTNNGYNQPAWVFTRGVGTGAKNIAEAASHEAGHNLGLSHDGTGSTGYYSGHGPWAPIMGVGYSKAITQWSKGEYSGANNTQDDYAVIGTNGVAVLPTDHGTTTGTATAISLNQTVNGVNASLTDVDYFRITLSAGTYVFTANAAAKGANLDIKLDVLDSAGTVVATANPAAGQIDARTATGLNAALTKSLAAGTYYVRIDDSGFANPLNTGYSTYGSAGAFSLRVTTG